MTDRISPRRRKHRSATVERDACLHLLGLLGKKIHWDHDPALGLRKFDEWTGLYDPDENDPRFIVPRLVDDHDVKTNGTHVPLSGDKSKIAKLKRVEEQERVRREILAQKACGQRRQTPSKWPKRPFQPRK